MMDVCRDLDGLEGSLLSLFRLRLYKTFDESKKVLDIEGFMSCLQLKSLIFQD
jgi:hypothetical protein